jgi:signal transduction histidine kinase
MVSKLGLKLLEEDLTRAQVDEEYLVNIQECQESIDIAVSILNDLLSYEKLEASIMTLYREVVPVTSFIQSTLSPFFLQVS